MKRIWIFIIFLIVSMWSMPQGQAKTKTLQQLIDQTPENGILQLPDTIYKENVVIRKSLTIKGSKHTILQSANQKPAIKIENAEQVTIENITVQNAHIGIVGKKSQHLHFKHLHFKNVWSGIQLYNTQDITLKHLEIAGIHGHYADKGNGLAIYNSANVTVQENNIQNVQDGVYIEAVNQISLSKNKIQNGRYALHFMYTKNGQATDNTFQKNVTGIMLMMSGNAKLSHNRLFEQNGLNASGMTLFQSKNINVFNNLFQNNRTAISAQNLTNSSMKKNTFLMNQSAIELIRSNEQNKINKNDFIGNIVNLRSDGSGSDIAQNYYDDYAGIDVDDNGIGDRSYVALQSFGQWMVRQPAYQYFIESPSVVLLNMMDRQTNAIEKKQLVDKEPMMQSAIIVESKSVRTVWKIILGFGMVLAILWFWRKEIQ